MFGWFKPKLPVERAEKLWIEHGMTWLVSQFGWDHLLKSPTILPTPEFFPTAYSPSRQGVQGLFEQVCRHMGLEPKRFSLAYYSDAPVDSREATAGLYDARPNETVIWLELSNIGNPAIVVAVLAHELSHALLLGENRISREDPDHELLTDLTVVFFGLGIFSANASVVDATTRVGYYSLWRIRKVGYLSPAMLGYAIALYAWLRGDERPSWAGHLRLDVRTDLKRSLGVLLRDGDSVIRRGTRIAAGQAWNPPDECRRKPSEDAGDDELAAKRSQPDDNDAADGDTDFDDAERCYVEGLRLLSQGRFQGAVEQFSRAIEERGGESEFFQHRSKAWLGLKRPSEALDDADRAVLLEPQESAAYLVRARAYLELGQFDDVISDVEQFLATTDEPAAVTLADALHLRGTAHVRLGNLKGALRDFSRAIHNAPGTAKVYESRAEVYEQLGRPDDAASDRAEAAHRREHFGQG